MTRTLMRCSSCGQQHC